MDKQNCEIRIEIATDYIDEQSEPDDGRYVFSYTITIANLGKLPARLLSRHWIITDANGKVQEVKGDGVVGEADGISEGHSDGNNVGIVDGSLPKCKSLEHVNEHCTF